MASTAARGSGDPKRVMLAAIAVFTAASALCGVASSLGELVAFRILQGAGGGMLAPVGMAMLCSRRRPGRDALTWPVSCFPGSVSGS